MQKFWVTVTRHHSSLCFMMNEKSHTVNVDNFRDMLQICHKHPGQKFEDPPVEEEIINFIRELRHTSEIKVLSDVNGMYHNKNVDYVYLLWEDLVFQVKNKSSKKNNDMYYLRFTIVIVDYFMAKDKAIPRKNKMFWHFARDDSMFTTIRVISKHQDTQVYGALLPQHLTSQVILESEAYKTYYAYANGEKTPKPKYVQKKADLDTSPKKKTIQAPKGKGLKAIAKMPESGKKKLPAQGLETLSEIALSEAEQIKVATKRSKIQFHSSHASGLGTDEGTGVSPGVPEEGVNIKEENLDEDMTNEEKEVDELYNDVNINLEGRDTKMTDASLTNVQATQVIEDTHVIMTYVTPKAQ
nr:hypothetical protein [Tanacetum cinerariifolium]